MALSAESQTEMVLADELDVNQNSTQGAVGSGSSPAVVTLCLSVMYFPKQPAGA
jgi:hypothetical protein